MQLPSGAINNAIVFNYNGKVYASDESRMLAEQKDDTFCLGSLDTYTYEEIFYGESEVVQKNGTLFCIKNAENGSKENQEITRTL